MTPYLEQATTEHKGAERQSLSLSLKISPDFEHLENLFLHLRQSLFIIGGELTSIVPAVQRVIFLWKSAALKTPC